MTKAHNINKEPADIRFQIDYIFDKNKWRVTDSIDCFRGLFSTKEEAKIYVKAFRQGFMHACKNGDKFKVEDFYKDTKDSTDNKE